MVKNNNIDYVIHPTYSVIHEEFEELKKYTTVIILQSDDKWRYDNFTRHYLPFVDKVITFEGEVEKFVNDGFDPGDVCKMRWAFNPNTMVNESNKDKNIHISHVGSPNHYRNEQLSKFSQLGTDVNHYFNLSYDEVKEIWSQSKYHLNFTINSQHSVREPKGRIVEVPHYGVLVTESFPTIDQYYNEDEIIIFDSIEEGIHQINFYDKNPKAFEKLNHNGKWALWNKNTVYHEWNKILPKIDKDFVKIDPTKLVKKEFKKHYYG